MNTQHLIEGKNVLRILKVNPEFVYKQAFYLWKEG